MLDYRLNLKPVNFRPAGRYINIRVVIVINHLLLTSLICIPSTSTLVSPRNSGVVIIGVVFMATIDGFADKHLAIEPEEFLIVSVVRHTNTLLTTDQVIAPNA